jgi:hypothetical protein
MPDYRHRLPVVSKGTFFSILQGESIVTTLAINKLENMAEQFRQTSPKPTI